MLDNHCPDFTKSINAANEHEILKEILGPQQLDSEPHDDRSDKFTLLILALVILLVLVFVVFVITFSMIWRTKTKFAKFKRNWIETYGKGNETLLDLNGDIVSQAEFFPYNADFEFPLENLKFESECDLGSGEFGDVKKATAIGILSTETESVVAVKKSHKKMGALRALGDEIKIMIYLQKLRSERHLNIVNLLGSITKNMSKFEVYAIVEFCPFGDLKSFMIKNSSKFVNQLDENGEFDPNMELESMKLENAQVSNYNYV